MGKIQKITMTVSVIIILVLAVLLGLFLWKEYHTAAVPEGETEIVEEDAGAGQLDAKEDISAGQLDAKEDESAGQLDAKEDAGAGQLDAKEDISAGQLDGEQQEAVTMFFTGDIMLGSSVREKYNAEGIQGILSDYLLQEMIQADITMVNEEFPFAVGGAPMPDKQYTFRVEPSYLNVFLDMGIDVVSLANNHALDYGAEALTETFQALKEAGISYVGAGAAKEEAKKAVYLECGQRTVGILAASRVIPVVEWNIENQQPGMLCTYDSAALVAAIQEAKKQCDYLVVYVHWGVEHQEHPEAYQRKLAQEYIDAGADLVVGSHPHVPQGIEYYQGKPIVYSLGNYIFNPNMGDTYALKVVWKEDGTSNMKILPIRTSDSKTQELTGREADELIQYIEDISYHVAVEKSGEVQPVADTGD